MPDILLNSCLLIVDFQDFFASKKSKGYVPQSEQIEPYLKKAVKYFLAQNLPVFATRHFNKNDKSDPFFRFYGKVIGRKDSLFQISKFVSDLNEITIIDKSTYSPFFNKTFTKKLKSKNIKNIFIAGFLLEKCILATSLDAFQRGYNVFILRECVATRNNKNEKIYFDLIARTCGKVVSFREIFNV
ncbi:MAG: cysteine hydrolase [Acidobacteria bacterium]|nr:cysteine hydrolase [Acidobacteriota bacterium]